MASHSYPRAAGRKDSEDRVVLPHMPAATFLGVLVGGTALLGWLAMRTFTARVLTSGCPPGGPRPVRW
jgi:hypothetical protein